LDTMAGPGIHDHTQRLDVRIGEDEDAVLVEPALGQRLAIGSIDGHPRRPRGLARLEPTLDLNLPVWPYDRLSFQAVGAGGDRKQHERQAGEDHTTVSATHGVFSDSACQPRSSGFTRTRKPTVKPSTIPSITAIGRCMMTSTSAQYSQSLTPP